MYLRKIKNKKFAEKWGIKSKFMYLSKLQGKNVFHVNCVERYNTYDNYLSTDWETDDSAPASP